SSRLEITTRCSGSSGNCSRSRPSSIAHADGLLRSSSDHATRKQQTAVSPSPQAADRRAAAAMFSRSAYEPVRERKDGSTSPVGACCWWDSPVLGEELCRVSSGAGSFLPARANHCACLCAAEWVVSAFVGVEGRTRNAPVRLN